MDVSKGHLLLREDGGLTVAKSVKYNVIGPDRDLQGLLPPGEAIDVHVGDEDDPSPTRKQRQEEIEFISRKLYEEENYSFDEVLALYDKLEALGDTDLRIGKKSCVSSWFSGAFVHGGKAGLRNNFKEYPNTTRYLASFGRKHAGGRTFSAFGIARNATLGLHRDSHNYKRSMNVVLPLSSFQGGGLWLQNEEVQEEKQVSRTLPSGRTVNGELVELEKGNPLEFRPNIWHEVQPWEGDRVVFLMYTPRASKLSREHAQQLEDCGFVIDYDSLGMVEEEEEDEFENAEGAVAKLHTIRMHHSPDPLTAFVEVEEEKFSVDKEERNMMRSVAKLRKAEVQYTPNIEDLLEPLDKEQKSLEVTHNVSLKDVKKNLPKWVESARKEYHNLKDNKRAFVVKKYSELPPGCRVVPCKGVYTVKPDKPPMNYRRKTRFVACGNHVPEEETCFDLFAAGLDASSLRSMLAFTAGRSWITATTDIRQAFVLAPWLGQAVALSPPSIAYELGIAEPGDYWLVQMSIYGLRESPSLWGSFRDQQLKLARWSAEVEGKEIELKLEQLVSDDQVWKIVRADN